MSAVRKVAERAVEPAARLDRMDWAPILEALNTCGFAVVRGAMTAAECGAFRALYEREATFRSRVVMARYGFGQGEYQYFSYPLPQTVEALRYALYARLAPVANTWADALRRDERYPASLDAFLKHCHASGQRRPTPLLLKYGAGDYNRLHQDLYGGVQFPMQAAVLLNAPGADFDGGEFVLTETAPRKQTRAEVVPLRQGDMVVFAVNHRPVASAKGFSRVAMRHGVSTIRRGSRMTLGIIFHDAV
jgi:uncharacterized protein